MVYAKNKYARMVLLLTIVVAFAFALGFQSEAKADDEKQFNVDSASEFYDAVEYKGEKVIKIRKNIKISQTYINSNTKIIATGRTISCPNGALRNAARKLNYGSVKDVEIVGGTWKSSHRLTLFQFVHGSDIELKNMNITCGITGHAIELIACKDVEINGCKVKGVGKCSKSCKEEQIQIDIATPRTAPTVKSYYGSKYTKGQTCQDIEIENCTVSGARGICANYASKENKYKKKFHKGITVKNCNITGKTSEALALFNSMDVDVKGNTIKTKSSRTGAAESIGCHLHIFGKISGIKNADRTAVIKNNKVWGGRQAIQVYSKT
ncbi:MAG: hypothetical protein IJ132_03855, partial [Firmicutes bacterium]|nr:hypothetical protein [Bacillota bacterium]